MATAGLWRWDGDSWRPRRTVSPGSTEAAKFKRRHPLDPAKFQYLEGCVRQEKPYTVPTFAENNDGPMLYVSFGSLGAGDVDLLKRIIATPPARVCREPLRLPCATSLLGR